MEGGIEDDSLRYIRHVRFHRRDAHHMRRIMQRRQIEETPDFLLHLVRNEDGALERFAAMDNTVANSFDLARWLSVRHAQDVQAASSTCEWLLYVQEFHLTL